MKHLRSVNRKAQRIDRAADLRNDVVRNDVVRNDVVALQGPPTPSQPHIPLGCTLIFSPGWEADHNGGTAGLCTPVERDIFDCHEGCFWPAQVPDQLNHAPDWTAKCASAQKDWRKIDLVFP